MTVGMEIWYIGEDICIDFVPFFMFLYITQVLYIIFPPK